MSASTEAVDRLGWSRSETARLMDALPLLDDPVDADLRTAMFHRLHWVPAVVALALFALARFGLLPAMPW